MASAATDNQPPAAADPAPPAAAEETEKAAAKSPRAGKKGETITVRGPELGRYRAGLHFANADTPVDLSTITREQLEAIESDPHLTVKRG